MTHNRLLLDSVALIEKSCMADPLETLSSDQSPQRPLVASIDREIRLMAGASASAVARPLRMLWDVGVLIGFSDGQLLDRLTTSPSDSAELVFQTLVERHGPMVLAVCRQVLVDPNDAADAFQATFLILFRRAGTIRNRAALASWLYGVAMRVAARAKVEAARRRRIEARCIRPVIGSDNALDCQEVKSLVHEELARATGEIPGADRPLLPRRSHPRSSSQSAWLASRDGPRSFVAGRDLLRARLTRRGVTATAALAAMDFMSHTATATVPAALRDAATQAAVQLATGHAIATVASARVAAWIGSALARSRNPTGRRPPSYFC